MPDLLRVTNPVPSQESTNINRNIPISPENTQIQNITDPTRVGRADGQTERQDNNLMGQGERIRYDSNFQTFLQRLREAPNLAQSLSQLFAGKEGTVVFSGMSAGIAAELGEVLQMLRMDEGQLLSFLTGQFKAGTRFGGALFALLRNAYARSSSDGVRLDILQFLRVYADHSSTKHIEGNILRNLNGMADSMPASWGEKLRDLIARLQNGMAAGDRQGNLQLLRQEVFPHMGSYVSRTHDMGEPRQLLTLLTLNMARYENGSESNLLQAFHRLNGYGTLRDQLGGIDDRSLLALLKASAFDESSAVGRFTERLVSAASRALSGEGDANTQQIFQQLVGAMLLNESVYMPINHFLIPLEWDGRMLFSELWVDPNDEDKENGGGEAGPRKNGVKLLFKMDVQQLGLFDIVMTSRDGQIDMRIACPEKVSGFSKEIEQAVAQILVNNGLSPQNVVVRKMERPVTLTEVFPQIFEGKNSVNVKV